MVLLTFSHTQFCWVVTQNPCWLTIKEITTIYGIRWPCLVSWGHLGTILTSGNPRLPQCSGDDSNVCLMDAGHWSSQGRKPCVERFLAHRKRVTSLKVSPDLREQLATGRLLGGRMGWVGEEWGRLARLVWISVRVKSGTNGWGLKDDLGVTTPVTSRVGTVSSLIYWGYTPFTKRVEPLSGLSHKVASSRLSRKVSFSQRPHGVASPSPVKTEAVSTSWDGLVKLWDYRTQRLLCSFDEHVPSPVTALAFAPVDGRFFVTTGGDAKLALFARR